MTIEQMTGASYFFGGAAVFFLILAVVLFFCLEIRKGWHIVMGTKLPQRQRGFTGELGIGNRSRTRKMTGATGSTNTSRTARTARTANTARTTNTSRTAETVPLTAMNGEGTKATTVLQDSEQTVVLTTVLGDSNQTTVLATQQEDLDRTVVLGHSPKPGEMELLLDITIVHTPVTV